MSYSEMMEKLSSLKNEFLTTKKEAAPAQVSEPPPEPPASESKELEQKKSEPTEPAVSEQPATDYSDAEKVAMRMGWKPKEKFYGKQDDWVDADTYINSGPIFKRQQALKEQFEKESKENQNLREMVKGLVEDIKSAKDRAYQEAIKDLSDQKQRAIELNDLQSYRALEDQEKALNPAQSKEPNEIPKDIRDNPDYSAYINSNPYMELVIGKKEEHPDYPIALAKHSYASMKVQEILNSGQRLSDKEQFDLATKVVNERFGEDNSQKRVPPPPSASIQSLSKQGKTPNRDSGKSISPLQLTASERYIYEGLGKDSTLGMTPDEYLKIVSKKRG